MRRWLAIDGSRSSGSYPVSGLQTLRYGEVGIASLKSLGLDDVTEVNILAALNNYNFGFVEDGVH